MEHMATIYKAGEIDQEGMEREERPDESAAPLRDRNAPRGTVIATSNTVCGQRETEGSRAEPLGSKRDPGLIDNRDEESTSSNRNQRRSRKRKRRESTKNTQKW